MTSAKKLLIKTGYLGEREGRHRTTLRLDRADWRRLGFDVLLRRAREAIEAAHPEYSEEDLRSVTFETVANSLLLMGADVDIVGKFSAKGRRRRWLLEVWLEFHDNKFRE